MTEIVNIEDVTVLLSTVQELLATWSGRPFILLLCDCDEAQLSLVVTELPMLVRIGCAEVCCIGGNSEFVHDSIDLKLEEFRALDVVTTWHESSEEGRDYFLFTAGLGKLEHVAVANCSVRSLLGLKNGSSL